MIKVVVCSLIAYLAVGVLIYAFQNSVIFPAPRTWANVNPANCNLKFEDLMIPVETGGEIHGWWIPSISGSDRAMLTLHGNGYVIEDTVGEELINLHASGINVLCIDYRGYGRSTAVRPDEKSLTEDARAALAYLQGRGFGLSDIFILGRSIGGAPATAIALENPGLGGLILETPFTSLPDAAAGNPLLRLYPIHLMLRSKFDNLSRIASIHTPLLVIAGTADSLTPPWMAGRLLDKANPPKQIFWVEHAGHNDIGTIGGAGIASAIRQFVQASNGV